MFLLRMPRGIMVRYPDRGVVVRCTVGSRKFGGWNPGLGKIFVKFQNPPPPKVSYR